MMDKGGYDMKRLTGFKVVAPSLIAVGEQFSLKIKPLTVPYFARAACYCVLPAAIGRFNLSPRGIRYMDNVPRGWRGVTRITADEGYEGPSEFVFDEATRIYPWDDRPVTALTGLRFTSPGVKFVHVEDRQTGVKGVSNPIVVEENPPELRLYWGDLHSQTFFSDGLRCPEELYYFARDEAFLDIFALADHAEHLTDRQWEYFSAVANDFNKDGRFVTLLGLEWTSRRFGHRNIYYPNACGPILRSTPGYESELTKIYEIAREYGALVIPHHSANRVMGVDWSLGHDPEVERLVEIYSIWGNSERPASAGNPRPIRTQQGEKAGQHVIDALKRGYQFGFIGGGDIHDGRPGDELHSLQPEPSQYRLLYRQGIMGVWARGLSRKSVFDALWNRSCYATTNVRVFLDFRVCGAFMGQQVRCDGVRPIYIRAASEVSISRVEIVRNGLDWRSCSPGQREFLWELEDTDKSPTWYYTRITRSDGEMAWSSPVWVNC